MNRKLLSGVFAGVFFAVSSSLALAEKLKSDNTEVNKSDRSEYAVTADQQSNEPKDVEITQRIRRELLKNEELSTYARNIKIITRYGKVVLRGPVRSAQEKSAAEKVAKNVAGVGNVQNQITITK